MRVSEAAFSDCGKLAYPARGLRSEKSRQDLSLPIPARSLSSPLRLSRIYLITGDRGFLLIVFDPS
jgi:hypothetical protein